MNNLETKTNDITITKEITIKDTKTGEATTFYFDANRDTMKQLTSWVKLRTSK